VTLDTAIWPEVVFTYGRNGVDKGTMLLKVCPHLGELTENWYIDRILNLALCPACYEASRKTS